MGIRKHGWIGTHHVISERTIPGGVVILTCEGLGCCYRETIKVKNALGRASKVRAAIKRHLGC